MGIPKTGVFGLVDFAGVDIALDSITSMASQLPKSDFYHSVNRDFTLTLLRKMTAEGYTGRNKHAALKLMQRDAGPIESRVAWLISLKWSHPHRVLAHDAFELRIGDATKCEKRCIVRPGRRRPRYGPKTGMAWPLSTGPCYIDAPT